MSFLARELQKNAALLQLGAKKHLDDIQEFQNIVNSLISDINQYMISRTNKSQVISWMKQYFGSSSFSFTAIDGTMFKTTVMDANIFFAGSYESSGTIYLDATNEKVKVEYNHTYSNKSRGISSVLPLQVAEVVEVDTQFDLDILRSDHGVQVTEDVILDQSNIAESIMLFSEYFLAYSSLKESKDKHPQIILFDRSISGDHSALIARTQKEILWKKTVNIIGYSPKGFEENPVDKNDLYWGRWFITENVDPIKPYFRFKILKVLLQSQSPLTHIDLSSKLQLERKFRNELISELKLLEKRKFIIHHNKSFAIHPEYSNSWKKLKSVVKEIGTRLFSTNTEELDTKSPFLLNKINEKGEIVEKWITTRDLSFLTLFCMYMIIEEARENNHIVLGLSKDSGAREFRRQFLPIISQHKKTEFNTNLYRLPHSDRAFLQQVSSQIPETIPWILTEYDAVFRTIIQDGDTVIGSKSNLPGIMQLFTKSYIQLQKSKSNPDLQSHVLALDRILTNNDITESNTKQFTFKKSEKNELEYNLTAHVGKHGTSGEVTIQDAILLILEAMTPHSLPEAFGHNKPLYIADKVAKFYLQEFKRLLTSIGNWISNDKQLTNNKLNKESFRENRTQVEQQRYLEH